MDNPTAPWDWMTQLGQTKKTLDREYVKKYYAPYVVHRMLSYHPDSLIYVNELNQRHHVDNDLQYDFLINTLRPRKRFTKMAKGHDADHVDAIMKTYNVNYHRALEIQGMLNDDQIKKIRDRLYSRGGIKK